MQYDLFSHLRYKFFSLGSGSSGNCYYLGNADSGILIDAGIGICTIKKTLREYGILMEKLAGVLITHDHADHIKTVGCLGGKHNIPVYTTEAIHRDIQTSKYVHVELQPVRRIIDKEKEFQINGFRITAFEVPHDSIENVGYHIEFEGETFVLVTDIGEVTDKIREYAARANHLVIEANYDEEMLRNGRYPYHLKQRISSGMGHLSNRHSAELIRSIYSHKMKNIWLCHLSQDNNHPEIAYKAVESALSTNGIKAGKDVSLQILSRYKASGLKEF